MGAKIKGLANVPLRRKFERAASGRDFRRFYQPTQNNDTFKGEKDIIWMICAENGRKMVELDRKKVVKNRLRGGQERWSN